MLKIDSDDLKIVYRLDDHIKRKYEARMRFVVSGNEGEGIVDAETCWDTAPPTNFHRERIWVDGKSYIQGITQGARNHLPRLPENLWSAIEGGRAMVLARELGNGTISRRFVSKGLMEFAYFEGEPGTPVEMANCQFESCIFWYCMFNNVHFKECDFLRSKFIGCRFVDCTVTNCEFDETVWGDLSNPATTFNFIENCVINGTVSFRKSKGVGAGLFMPIQAITIAVQDIESGNYSSWKGEQIRDAIETHKW